MSHEVIIPRTASEEKLLQLNSLAVLDYLKNNNHRVATHTLSRTDGPLASRSDFKEVVPLIKEENAKINVLSLDGDSTPSMATLIFSEELVGHVADDQDYSKGLATTVNITSFEEKRFFFITNGIVFPELVEMGDNAGCPVDFIETRFDPVKVHRIDNPKLYLRNIISKVRRLKKEFIESEHTCECGTQVLQGQYVVSYWGKEKEFRYYVCPSCGIQMEDPNTVQQISSFVQGLD